MKTQVTFAAFVQAFEDMGRYGHFGHDALTVLFDYLEQLEKDTGEEIELNVMALCCDFEVMTLDEINEQYNEEWEDIEDAIEFLEYETVVIPVYDESVIVQQF